MCAGERHEEKQLKYKMISFTNARLSRKYEESQNDLK